MFTQEKLIHIIMVALLLIAVQVIVFVEYFGIPERTRSIQNDGIVCTQEAKLCPDGSAVGRTGPNCEFAECAKTVIEQMDTSSWKTYRNEEYGFEFKYLGGRDVYLNWDLKGSRPEGLFIYISLPENGSAHWNDLLNSLQLDNGYIVTELAYKVAGEPAYKIIETNYGTVEIMLHHNGFIYTFEPGEYFLQNIILSTFKFIK